MTKPNESANFTVEARKSLRSNIKFLKNLEKDLLSNNHDKITRALWGAWVIHTYMQNNFIQDVAEAIGNVEKNEMV